MEFESREVALRDYLESDFQADLDGRLLLAEIRHQKEIDQLRVELVGREEPSAETAAGPMVVYSPETPQREREGQGTAASSSTARRPSLSRRPVQNPTAGVETTPNGNLGRKFRAFKPPVQAVAPGAAKKTERYVFLRREIHGKADAHF